MDDEDDDCVVDGVASVVVMVNSFSSCLRVLVVAINNLGRDCNAFWRVSMIGGLLYVRRPTKRRKRRSVSSAFLRARFGNGLCVIGCLEPHVS